MRQHCRVNRTTARVTRTFRVFRRDGIGQHQGMADIGIDSGRLEFCNHPLMLKSGLISNILYDVTIAL